MTDADTMAYEAPPRGSVGRRATRSVFEWIAVLVVAVAMSFLIRTFVFQTFYIPSKSMVPTLRVGDRIVVDKLAVEFGTIHRGDILVFHTPPGELAACGGQPVPDLVKRVVGLPGEVIFSRGNTIYIDGKALDQTWAHREPLFRAIARQVIPANHYFMMGDNQTYSCDSRYWGTIPRSSIVGKVFVRIWPLSRLGFL